MAFAGAQVDEPMSREDYRRWCGAQPRGRCERVNGRIVAMGPERVAHVRMKVAVHRARERAVRDAGVACEAFADGVTVEAGDSDFAPDALVNCAAPVSEDAIAAPNPVIVVEVLSPGTASVDTSRKLAGYFRAPSIVTTSSWTRSGRWSSITVGPANSSPRGSSLRARSPWSRPASSSRWTRSMAHDDRSLGIDVSTL